MKKIFSLLTLSAVFFLSCEKASVKKGESETANDILESQGSQPIKEGVITAAEWNDLDNWSFWNKVIEKKDFSSIPARWAFFNTNRVSLKLFNLNSEPLSNVIIHLKKGNEIIFSARTDNSGSAELWPNLRENAAVNFSDYNIDINNGAKIVTDIKSYNDGINVVRADISAKGENEINVSFVVDATGSMGDEIKYLKTEMKDVLNRVRSENPNFNVLTSSVFYRDTDDDYLTRVSEFTNDAQTTIDFLNDQSAGGGGDYPEAVHTALDKAVNGLSWTESAKTKIVFLLLDAPPHFKSDVVSNIHNSVSEAAKKGIKIIPILASGGDKETEFLLRFMAISTNGTYVFITDDSGKGNKHMEASVGNFKIEFLNNLMARLINKYAE